MPVSDGGLSGVHGGRKKKWQWVADLAGTYGIGIVGTVTHECRVGLWANSERIEFRKCHRVILGIRQALAKRLERAQVEAITNTAWEANEFQGLESMALEE